MIFPDEASRASRFADRLRVRPIPRRSLDGLVA